MNVFAYVGGNPLRWVDPAGLDYDPRYGEVQPGDVAPNPYNVVGLESHTSTWEIGEPAEPGDRNWWDLLEAGHYFGTGFGEEAVDYYACKYNETGNPLYKVGGVVAELWMPETWMETASLLSLAQLAQWTGISKLGPSVTWKGGEIVITNSAGKQIFRLNPFGSRKYDNPYSKWPHYHRPPMKWHRPWQKGW